MTPELALLLYGYVVGILTGFYARPLCDAFWRGFRGPHFTPAFTGSRSRPVLFPRACWA